MLFLSDDEDFLAKMRGRDIPAKTMIGTPAQLTEIVAAYRDAGVDELIIPDFTLGTGQRRDETLDRFMTEVAVALRAHPDRSLLIGAAARTSRAQPASTLTPTVSS